GEDTSVLVPVSIANNPGFASLKLTVSVPEGWTTSNVYLYNGDETAITGGMTASFKIDAKSNSDVVLTFAGSEDVTADGVLAWVEYVPGSSVEAGSYEISVTVDEAYSAGSINTDAASAYTTVDGTIAVSAALLSVGSVTADAAPGTVLVPVNIANNPGFASMAVMVSVPDGWTASDVVRLNGSEMAITGNMNLQKNLTGDDGVVVSLAGAENVTGDGVLFWVEYTIPADTDNGAYAITATLTELFSADDLETNVVEASATEVGGVDVEIVAENDESAENAESGEGTESAENAESGESTESAESAESG
ncbi:MAG: hypothetical protein LIO55_04455, partial [Oscillospiraceae bacterium]|nr:hypothetical protein [Oscillospiraceae bacterium]